MDSMRFLVQNNEILPIIDKCSSFLKLQQILAWCVRFKENTRNPLQITTGSLTVTELSTALFCLVRNVQSVYFSKEIWCIERGQQLPDSSNLLTLSPFLDERKILYVGGRLRHSNLSTEQKHPMLIPNNHPICDLIIKHYHVSYLHTGTEATLANIRSKFWIVNGRSKVKRVIKQCIKCLKVSAKGKNQMMADLPSVRVSIASVFNKVGLDFCGPFLIKLIPEANLKLSPSKCHLFRREVTYLGHIISAEGVRTDPDKIWAVKNWKSQTDVHQLRSFLGLCTYYRKFVKDFSTIARPLHKLTEANQKFIWTDECNDAFNKLKDALTSAPILAYPEAGEQFILDTDASHESIGAVLSQEIDGQERVIAYFSKCLSRPERNYCVTRKELLAIVKAIEHFYPYLYGRRFLLRTDHASLIWLLNFKNPEGQIARWIQRLQDLLSKLLEATSFVILIKSKE
ncbi:retrovirus-related Pol polyprotein from transposon 17.6 [Trichonephila clavata]|uniref:RNA-directed DNA polymerase n=1 Tax=Trichonephila clavata TaxID=2740835 RepID=A0A8X6JLD4_TRICU|nr:retrovirus-related Pol polyprotein from transposon 17.6 [Trichonephila clavata]